MIFLIYFTLEFEKMKCCYLLCQKIFIKRLLIITVQICLYKADKFKQRLSLLFYIFIIPYFILTCDNIAGIRYYN